MRKAALRLGIGIGMAFSTAAGTAAGHPVHEVVQNAYLTLAPGTVAFQLELTAGPAVAGRIVAAIDADGDRRVDRQEAATFGTRVLASSRLLVDGRPVRLRLTSIAVPSYPALLGAHGIVNILARAVRTDRPGTATILYHNGYSPAESRCDANVFVAPGSHPAYRIAAQARSADGRTLVVRYAAAP